MSITVTVRIAFTSNAFAASPTWVDISSDVERLSIRRGRQYYLNRIQAGTATIYLRNNHGNYWANNSSGPYYGYILPIKRVNIRVTYNGITYDKFTGYVESWKPDFTLQGLKGPVMVLNCVEAQKRMGRFPLAASSYSAELTGTRVTNVLDDIGWPAAARNIATGQVQVAAGPGVKTNALTHLYEVQEAELGLFFISKDGKATFHDRLTRNASPYNTSQATFGDSGSDLRYMSPKVILDDEFVYNQVTGQASGGAVKAADDITRQARDGLSSLDRGTLILTTDDDVQDQIWFLLRRFRDASQRLEAITIMPYQNESGLYPKVLGYDISTRITVKLTQANINAQFHIEGISDDWEAARPNSWRTTWQLSNASDLVYPTRTTVTLLPNGAGTYTACYPRPAEYANWECVRVVDDGLKVEGIYQNTDSYALENMSELVPILKLKVITYAATTGGTAGSCTLFVIIDGTRYDGDPFTVQPPGVYNYYESIIDVGPLSLEQINSMEIGVLKATGLYIDYMALGIETYTDW